MKKYTPATLKIEDIQLSEDQTDADIFGQQAYNVYLQSQAGVSFGYRVTLTDEEAMQIQLTGLMPVYKMPYFSSRYDES